MDKGRGHEFLSVGLKKRAVRRWRSEGTSVSIAIVDLDALTAINKRFGDAVGDAVLAVVAQEVGGAGAGHDWGRCGDDTFFALHVGLRLEGMRRCAERIASSVRDYSWSELASGLWVTCSVGIAELQEKEPPSDFVIRAAIGMNRAKENGGDDVESGPRYLPRETPANRDLRLVTSIPRRRNRRG